MATSLDLQEQEQIDALKAFWKQYGNLITWALTIVLAGFAAWNGWNWWQRDQAVKAAAMFDELERAAIAGEVTKAGGIFNDMKERFPRTAYAQQGGLVAAKVQFEKGQPDAAVATLGWVAGNATESEYQTVARLRKAEVDERAKVPPLRAELAGDMNAVVARCLEITKTSPGPLLYLDLQTSMDLREGKWFSLGSFTPLTKADDFDKRDFTGVLRYIRWVAALANADQRAHLTALSS